MINPAISAVTEELSRNTQNIMGNRLRKIILYGSYARGDYKQYSDLDLMVLGSFDEDEKKIFENEIDKVASDIGLDHDIIVSVLLNDENLFMSRLHISPFYRNVLSEGVEIYGTHYFPKEMSRIIDTLFKVRNKCDYDDFYLISKEDVMNQLSSAEYFLDEIRKHLQAKI